jgi:transcriptional regulator with XRE-family HTH domain
MSAFHSEAAHVLGARIREARNQRSLTLEDLGALAGVHWTNIGKIERGQVHPSVETLVRLASAMDADPKVFVTGHTADMYPRPRHKLTANDLIREREERSRRRDAD